MNEIEMKTAVKLPFWRRIRWTLIVSYVLLAIIPMITLGAIIIDNTRTQIERQAYNQLESIATLKQNHIADWISQLSLSLEQFALGRSNFIVLILDFPSAQAELNPLFQETVDLLPVFQSMFLYDLEGQIIAASDPTRIGQSVADQPYYLPSLDPENHQQGERGGHLDYMHPPYYNEQRDELMMIVTHTIRESETGRPIAILAAEPDLAVLNEIMLERAGLSRTGDTYLVSRATHFLLTPSRFEADGYAQLQAYHSDGIDRALQGESGSGAYTNYQSPPQEVYGVYHWVPVLEAGLLVEVSVADAQAPAEAIRQFGRVVFVLIGVIAGLIGFVAAQQIATPLIALTEGALHISAGDLHQRVNIKQRNEIGVLADTFNQMSARLSELVEGLETEVERRTLKAQEAVQEAETARQAAEQLNQALADQIWRAQGLAQLNTQMRGEQAATTLANQVIGQLCRTVDAQVGALYLLQEDDWLVLAGSYAFDLANGRYQQLKIGQGLVGQAAQEKREKRLDDLPINYLTVTSGLGQNHPRHVCALPFSYEGQLKGVVEIGSWRPLATIKKEFLHEAMENIGIAFHTAQARARIDDLLAQSQRQAEELQAREEELIAINEELEAQSEYKGMRSED